MSGFVPGTGREDALSASTLPPEDEPPDSSSTAGVFPVLLSPTPGPEDLRYVDRQSSPSRSSRTHHAALTPRSLTAGSGRGTTETDTLGGAQLPPSTQTDPRLPSERYTNRPDLRGVKFDCSQHCDWLYPFPSAKLDRPKAVSSARSPCSCTPRHFLTHPNHPF